VTLLRFLARDLTADWRRGLLTVLAIAPIATAFLIVMGISTGLRGPEIPLSRQNVLVVSANALDTASGRLDPAVLDLARATAGEDAASVGPMIFRPIKAGDTIVQLRAAPLADWTEVHGLALLNGRLPAPGADEMAVTEGIAAATGWAPGDRVEIFGTEFAVTGSLRAPGTKFASVWMDFDRADRLFEGAAGYQIVAVRPAPGTDPVELRNRLAAAAPPAVAVYFESAIENEQAARSATAGRLSQVAAGIAVAALAFAAFNLTALTLAERRRDLGIARALGFAPGALSTAVVVRSVLLAAAGYALGAAAAAAITVARPEVSVRSFVVDVSPTAASWITGAVLAIGVSAAGAWVPARSAGRRPIRSLLEER
jgi:putative ABC transport system permease protein